MLITAKQNKYFCSVFYNMHENQSTKESAKETAQNASYFLDSSTDVEDYRRIIMQLRNEIIAQNARLKGVEALTVMLNESEERCKRMEDTAKNYQLTLKRAEARIAQLNKMSGIGPQSAFNLGVVTPGISRKDFELVTQENLKLKKALEHIVPAKLGGQAVILKNQELYELVSTLQEELSRSEDHIKELGLALRGQENGQTAAMVPDLTKKMTKLERCLVAKQVFCEALMMENEKLKHLSEGIRKAGVQEEMPDSIDGRERKAESYNPWEDPAIRYRIDKLGEENENVRKQYEELLKHNVELQKQNEELSSSISNLDKEVTRLQEANKNLNIQVTGMATTQKEKLEEIQKKASQEKEKLAKENIEYRKKCDGFFQQVISMNSKQKESDEELDRMKRAFDHQAAEMEEKKSLNNLMSESLKSYEDDFRRENEERSKCQKQLEKAQQECERVKRENQSHNATIRHLEDEFERMNKMLNEERKKSHDLKSKGPGTMFGLRNNYAALAAAGPRTFMPENRPMQVVADGGGIDESDSQGKKDPYSMPTTKSEASSTPSLIECPYCSRSYPYHLIEGHVQDCMEDSLYNDEKN